MIKAENRLDDEGNPSGAEFAPPECDALVQYASILGGKVLSKVSV
jgi:hypothetical protein